MPMSLTQNKKIAVTAVALFLLSFTFMLFFLENGGVDSDHGSADVLSSGNHAEEPTSTAIDLDSFYREYLPDECDAPMFVTNAEGLVAYSSDDFCDLISVDCENLVGTTMFDYINSKDLSDTFSNHTKLLQNGEASEAIGPYRMIKNDGEVLVLLSAYPILDDEEKVSEVVFSVKDLTEKVDEMNSDDHDNRNGNELEENGWIYDLYPKIKDTRDQIEVRMMVDKISFSAGE